MDDNLKQKRVLVVGMARSGVAAAKLLCALGATPVLSDTRTDIEGMDELQAMGCLPRLGEDAAQLVASCDFAVISPAVTLKAPVVTTAKRLGIPVLGAVSYTHLDVYKRQRFRMCWG